MINFKVIFKSLFSKTLVLAFLMSQNICAAEALLHDCVPHTHSTNADSHQASGHQDHDSHGTSHEHKNENDSCCKRQTPALLSSTISSSQIKTIFLAYPLAVQSLVSFKIEDPIEYVRLANESPPGITFQSQLISSLLISPNAPPASYLP